jgi:hypothetical protein
MLPVIATLHARHAPVRHSGAVLGTIAGASVVVLGLLSAQAPGFVVSAVFVAGVWWWTIGKMWLETAVLPRVFGAVTMGLAVVCFGAVLAFALVGTALPQAIPLEITKLLSQTVLAVVLGPWLVAIAPLLWRMAR